MAGGGVFAPLGLYGATRGICLKCRSSDPPRISQFSTCLAPRPNPPAEHMFKKPCRVCGCQLVMARSSSAVPPSGRSESASSAAYQSCARHDRVVVGASSLGLAWVAAGIPPETSPAAGTCRAKRSACRRWASHLVACLRRVNVPESAGFRVALRAGRGVPRREAPNLAHWGQLGLIPSS